MTDSDYNKGPKILEITRFGDENKGYLSAVEELSSLFPFEIKRTYWTYGATEGAEKGNQANKKSQQLVIAVQGSISIHLESVDGEKTVYELFSPQQAMYIPPMYWRKIVPSDDAIIICLASEKYYPEDYIIDYSEFKNSTSSNLQ